MEVELVESGGGVFEVTADGRKIHSKQETGEHADPDDVVRTLRAEE